MALWVYEARDRAGKVVRGSHEALDRRVALEFLRDQGLFLTRLEAARAAPRAHVGVQPPLEAPPAAPRSTNGVAPAVTTAVTTAPRNPAATSVTAPAATATPVTVPAPRGAPNSGAGTPIAVQPLLRASTKELSLYFRQLGAMIHAGTSLGAALHAMSESAPNGALRSASAQMEKRVLGGEPLSGAMKSFPGLFSPLQLGIVDAGERGGLLDVLFARLSRYSERDYELQQTIKSETWYPKLLVFLSILIPGLVPLIVWFIKGGAFPFAALMASVGIPLAVLGGVWGAFQAWKFASPLAMHGSVLKLWLDAFKLRFPVGGKVVRAFAAAKFCRALGALWGAGVGPGESVRLAASACGNAAMARDALSIIPRLERGEGFTACLASTRQFPISVLQVMRVGEESGTLDEQLDKSADFLESDAEVAVKQAVKVLGIVVFLLIASSIGYQVITFWMSYFDAAFNAGESLANG